MRLQDEPEPSAGHGEVLLRVRACALNHLDLWVRRGMPGVRLPLPLVPGSDIAGQVEAVGPGVSGVRAGQRVLLAPGLSCRSCPQCNAGQDNCCPQYKIQGFGLDGGYREFMAVPEYAVIPIPDHLDFEQAAAAPLVFLTAWRMLLTLARLQPGETVLVLAAGSGVGMAAVQIARLLRCRVIATAGGEAKLEKARELGADDVIDHYRQDIAAEVRRLTDKRGADVVFEHVGASTWNASLASLAPKGRLVTCGATTGPEVKLDLRFLFVRQQSILGSFMGTLGELHQVLRLIFDGTLRPVVDAVFSLSEAAQAHQRLEQKEQFGKVVLRV